MCLYKKVKSYTGYLWRSVTDRKVLFQVYWM